MEFFFFLNSVAPFWSAIDVYCVRKRKTSILQKKGEGNGRREDGKQGYLILLFKQQVEGADSKDEDADGSEDVVVDNVAVVPALVLREP